MRGAGPALGAAAALALLGGCSVAADGNATPIAVEAVPYDLLDPQAPSVAPVLDGRSVAVCLLRDEQLVVVERQVERDAGLRGVLTSLAVTSEAEGAAGLETAIGGGEDIDAVTTGAGVATVDFAAGADQTLTPDPLSTIAQIVCTLTHQPGVGSVRFTVDGDVIEVPRDDGSLTDAAVTRDDYAAMVSVP